MSKLDEEQKAYMLNVWKNVLLNNSEYPTATFEAGARALLEFAKENPSYIDADIGLRGRFIWIDKLEEFFK